MKIKFISLIIFINNAIAESTIKKIQKKTDPDVVIKEDIHQKKYNKKKIIEQLKKAQNILNNNKKIIKNYEEALENYKKISKTLTAQYQTGKNLESKLESEKEEIIFILEEKEELEKSEEIKITSYQQLNNIYKNIIITKIKNKKLEKLKIILEELENNIQMVKNKITKISLAKENNKKTIENLTLKIETINNKIIQQEKTIIQLNSNLNNLQQSIETKEKLTTLEKK